MTTSCRSWWRNCAIEADSEIIGIDRMEDHITPIDPNISKIRELISSLELCHHKAEQWVYNIIEAIGAGETKKGLGTRSPGRFHPAEKTWQNACAALSAWCAGCPGSSVHSPVSVGRVPVSRLLACLGERSPLKEWQVLRVIDKIRSTIHWPQSCDDPAAQYVWLLLSGGEYELTYRRQCPEHYSEHEDFWLTTARTIIHDTVDGKQSELSLALAIDMLMPCHWNFTENLQIVLEAIGGKLHPGKPFSACGRNIVLLPISDRMEIVSGTLRYFCGDMEKDTDVDGEMLGGRPRIAKNIGIQYKGEHKIRPYKGFPGEGRGEPCVHPALSDSLLAVLGEPTEVKRWLAASLDKTIRLQLDPPARLRALSALEGPAWIKQ